MSVNKCVLQKVNILASTFLKDTVGHFFMSCTEANKLTYLLVLCIYTKSDISFFIYAVDLVVVKKQVNESDCCPG